ncbi:hypothetical protein TEA_006540 [Camellia sinensis var. sinensis]|uniref:Alcohol dehydrogenase-like N-terminal domain-containing protein n=1 Tax=Camellia sinensis var. sinensis TaxID=542762 RepID=A0A4S4DZT7_CAMSN|nr:hypothetical protein TEA_006540 [Camellia sinensis var. sinensis]
MESKQQSETAGKPIRCKGLNLLLKSGFLFLTVTLVLKAGEALVIEEIEVDPPKAFEVRIKILCTSLCHTDVTFWKLNVGPVAVFPRIFGHEAVGVVESVGENVEEVQEGDRVLPVFNADCGECRDCKSSKSNSCSSFPITHLNGVPRDGTSRFRDSNGDVLHHFLFVSSFTEYTVVDIANIVKINSLIPVDKACLLSCGVSTGVGATFKVAAVEEGSTVAIFGLGAVGLAGWGRTVILGVEMHGTPLSISTLEIMRGRTVGGDYYDYYCHRRHRHHCRPMPLSSFLLTNPSTLIASSSSSLPSTVAKSLTFYHLWRLLQLQLISRRSLPRHYSPMLPPCQYLQIRVSRCDTALTD